jgi:hypothetical protein
MKRSAIVLVAVAALAAAGLGVAALAHVKAFQSSGGGASGGLDVARWMPADANLVAFLDFQSLARSPLRDRWEERQTERYFEKIDEFRAATGLDPWTDLGSVLVSTASSGGDARSHWAAAVTGRFDAARVLSEIEKRAEGARVERRTHRNVLMYVIGHPREGARQETMAVAFPDSGTALFAPPERLQAMIDAGRGHASSVTSGPLGSWLAELIPGETAWVVGTAEGDVARLLGQASRQGGPPIPPLRFFALSARLDNGVEAHGTAEATDPDAARKLADVVRGFVALGGLRAQQEPEISAVIDSVRIETAENRIEVSVTIPYELLDRFSTPRKRTGEE